VELRRLEALIGTWQTEGRVLGTDAEISGTDSYEWLGTGFVVHTVDVTMGGAHVEAIELIGAWDPAAQAFTAVAYDGSGSVSTMHAHVSDEGVITFSDDTTRATMVVAPGGVAATAGWERRDDAGRWIPWMELRFTRLT
jgi:hypothetical protein